MIRALTSSGHGVETVEALAGTGKTFTAGLLAEAYTTGGYRVLGAAPTGRAVRELTEHAGIAQAWTLTRLALDLEADQGGFGSGPVVLILDEAGMASTRETARVLAHAQAAGVKVIAIGDSGQLSSVQAGGWLGSLTERLGSHELREVMRQRDPRERQLLAQVRSGDSAAYAAEKAARGHVHVYAGDAQRASAGERAAVAAWRDHQTACPWGQAVLIVRDNQRRERLNTLIRSGLKREGRLGESVHIGVCDFAVGDRVVARRNDRERAVDNGMRGTVIAVDPNEKDLVVRTDAGAHRRLDATYVADHLQHAYALTAHTIQGATVEWAGVVGRPRTSPATGPTPRSPPRARADRAATSSTLQPEAPSSTAPGSPPARPAELGDRANPHRAPRGRSCAAAIDEDLALDRVDGERTRARVPSSRRRSTPDLPTTLGVSRRSVDELRRPSSRGYASASATTPTTSPTSWHAARSAQRRRSAARRRRKRARASPSSRSPRSGRAAPHAPPSSAGR